MLTAKMTMMEEEEAAGTVSGAIAGGEDEEDLDAEGNIQADVDMRLARLEHLMDRRCANKTNLRTHVISLMSIIAGLSFSVLYCCAKIRTIVQSGKNELIYLRTTLRSRL